jgi:hypothetical protein
LNYCLADKLEKVDWLVEGIDWKGQKHRLAHGCRSAWTAASGRKQTVCFWVTEAEKRTLARATIQRLLSTYCGHSQLVRHGAAGSAPQMK